MPIKESKWMDCIDTYFNSCHNNVNLGDINPENRKDPENKNEVEKELEPRKTDPEAHVEVSSRLPRLSPPHTQQQNIASHTIFKGEGRLFLRRQEIEDESQVSHVVNTFTVQYNRHLP